jgi:hypothetical protein
MVSRPLTSLNKSTPMRAMTPIPYDASRTALYSPQKSEPPADFSAGWDVDWICAELSRLAYCRFEAGDGPRLDAALTSAGFAKAATFIDAPAGAEAIATTTPDGTAFVACRGTQPDDLGDLVADAKAVKVEFRPGAKVHAGFLDAWRAIERPVDEWLAAAKPSRVVFTGHSLGAAMATIAAATRPAAELVTFGSPLVGDWGFASLLADSKLRRYVDCTDVITAVPPPLLGYVHVCPERYIDRFGKLHASPPAPEAIADDRRLGRRAYLRDYAWQVWRNVLARDLADHAPVNYVSGVTGRRA